MTIRWPLLARRIHKWLGLVLGIQVVLWTVTGFYMVTVHIDYIHGDHLIKKPASASFDLTQFAAPAQVLAANPDVKELRLQSFLGRPVWRAETAKAPILLDGATGAKLPALTEEQVRQAAREVYTGNPNIVSMKLLTGAPLEMQTRKPPFWQVEFEGWNRPTLYISPTSGELISRRHALWRVFDFAWMLHIMDYDTRSNVNTPLLRIATISAAVMALSGAWLLVWSFPRRKKKKA